MIKRIIQLKDLLPKKSYFLLGPRQVGKTTLIKQQFPNARMYNLLLMEDFKKLSFDRSLIRKELKPKNDIIIIDEIQKLPELLDEVHYLIEEKNIKFLLTGSSARRLLKTNVNLLGGRVRPLNLHPFTIQELGKFFNLHKFLQYGSIPGIYFSDDPDTDLDAYIGMYLEQEISKEGLTRSLTTFSRFLEVASLRNAETIDFTSVSNDAQIPRTTIYEYFKILEDTLIGYLIPPWKESKKRKPISSSKFYFFDWGITRKLQGIKNISPKTELFGKAFESLIFQELKAYCSYNKIKNLNFWRTYQKDEVDFILDNRVAIEVKSNNVFKKKYVKSLANLYKEKILEKYYIVYTGPDLFLDEYKWLKIKNYKSFIKELYSGKILR